MSCGDDSFQRIHSLEDVQEWVRPELSLEEESMRQTIRHEAATQPIHMYADRYARTYYQAATPLVWITRMGINPEADTLLTWVGQAETLGMDGSVFHADTIRTLLMQIRQQDFSATNINRLTGRLEFLLTRALLRYACGQRYGFVLPRPLLNHLLLDEPPREGKPTVFRRIYDLHSDEPTDSFVHHAIEEVRHHRLSSFLQEIQPTDTLYRLMQAEYLRAQTAGDTARARLARINLERARWRYPHPTGGKYVFVNLAEQALMAVDTERDTMLTMRICCGNASHKTPLLHSEIRWGELNPYWVIPQSIVSKEIMPRHVGDSAYYARNNYHAVDKMTREIIDPSQLSAAQLRSGQYTLRQEKGAGNSLGRIIFRFPNSFSVYLHDTNNRSAFQYANRAISHGCVRVERPLDLALFLLESPTDFFVDRIRMAIDLPPLSPTGIRYQATHPDAKPLSRFDFPTPIPVWLDYWTLYPTPEGTLASHSDKYGYDQAIEKVLNTY
ncbi:MAG: L,D-transpeptidase family protein [Bacteroidaceae bacterium]|nr:L,D-transpeptidase family protein [Bacteroidaceae bacterium]